MALRNRKASWLGVGRRIANLSDVWSGVCRCFLAPYEVSLSSPKPLISPVTSRLGVVCRLSKPHC
jgi:hypothetical protein